MGRKDPFIDNSIRYLEHLKCYAEGNFPDINCFAGYHSILIDCYGNIFPCFQYFENNEAIKRVGEYTDIKELWYGRDYNKIRKELLKCRECFFICQMEPNEIYNSFGHR